MAKRRNQDDEVNRSTSRSSVEKTTTPLSPDEFAGLGRSTEAILGWLPTFLDVFRAGGMQRAAQVFGVDVGGVSRKIGQLEEALGVALFDPKTRRVPTAAGELLQKHVQRAIDDINAARRLISSNELHSNTLKIGYSAGVRDLVVRAIGELVGKNQLQRVELTEAPAATVEEQVILEKLHLGVTLMADHKNSLLVPSPILEITPMLLVVPNGHALGKAERFRTSDIEHEPLALLGKGLRSREAADSCLRAMNLHTPRVVFEANSVAPILALVRAGSAIALFPSPSLSDLDLEQLAIRRIPGPIATGYSLKTVAIKSSRSESIAAVDWAIGALKTALARASQREFSAIQWVND